MEDCDLCLRIVEVSEHLRLDDHLYKYRLNPSSATAALDWEAKSYKTRHMLQTWIDYLQMPGATVNSPNKSKASEIAFIKTM